MGSRINEIILMTRWSVGLLEEGKVVATGEIQWSIGFELLRGK